MIVLFILCLGMTGCISQTFAWRPDVQAYTNELVHKYHFDRKELQKLFCRLHSNPDVMRHLNRPAEGMPWMKYEAAFLTQKRVAGGSQFFKLHRTALMHLEKQYGVPAAVIVAVIGVETNYGEYQPKYSAAEALATIGFSHSRRHAFFRSELTELLLLSREMQVDPLHWRSSYAGALGIPQFMPSSYRKYAVKYQGPDQEQGGPIDLDHNMLDAMASVAHYLQHFGWQPHHLIVKKMHAAGTPGQKHVLALKENSGLEYWHTLHNFDVILRYNTSSWYAMTVYELATAIEKGQQQA